MSNNQVDLARMRLAERILVSPENYVEAVDELVREVRLDTLRQLSALDMENAGRSWVDVAMERLL